METPKWLRDWAWAQQTVLQGSRLRASCAVAADRAETQGNKLGENEFWYPIGAKDVFSPNKLGLMIFNEQHHFWGGNQQSDLFRWIGIMTILQQDRQSGDGEIVAF